MELIFQKKNSKLLNNINSLVLLILKLIIVNNKKNIRILLKKSILEIIKIEAYK